MKVDVYKIGTSTSVYQVDRQDLDKSRSLWGLYPVNGMLKSENVIFEKKVTETITENVEKAMIRNLKGGGRVD
ncbi:MAG: hypothetical protein HUJ74_03190 [Lachnospiraceae bacterium]|nr:hypothetical protein [Lachnospiraceae bacterium]